MTSRRGSAFFPFILGLALGALLGVVLTQKYLTDRPAGATTGTSVERPAATPPAPAPSSSATNEDTLQRKLREWKLTPDDLKRDLSKAGEVIRQKSGEIGSKVADATSDVRIIAVIKAKYTIDDKLSAWDITVGSKDGHVALSGTVSSPELIGRAIALALDTNGVVDVKSTLQVK